MIIKTIGIMTGNSLDAADAVLSVFDDDDGVCDLAAFSLPYPPALRERFLRLKENIKYYVSMAETAADPLFAATVEAYTRLVAETVNRLLETSGADKREIAAIGFHGQTCDHFPPSAAGGSEPYTLQVGDPRLLADLTGIPVIYDFRSDDLMNGGEGAPLAPLHNRRIARMMQNKGFDSVAFCNGGNTGNIAVIGREEGSKTSAVAGWDTGPFNHLPDLLMREYRGLPFDENGAFGRGGQIRPELLRRLFNEAALSAGGENFYLRRPPKSSDPRWYRKIYDENLSFADNLRTAEYLSAYGFVYNLRYVPPAMSLPSLYLLFGGGWKNPLVRGDFESLLQGKGVILPEHKEVFAAVYTRLPKKTTADWADKFGFSGEYMEARIFADMACCKILNRPFSLPETTGCRTPTVGGIYVLPDGGGDYLLTELLQRCGNPARPEKNPLLWSRAAKGWQKSFAAAGENV